MRFFTVVPTKKNHDGLRNFKKIQGSNLEPYDSKLRYFDEGNPNQNLGTERGTRRLELGVVFRVLVLVYLTLLWLHYQYNKHFRLYTEI